MILQKKELVTKVKTTKVKVTYLAIIRNVLREEREARADAKEVAKSKLKWERDMVKAYLADADDYKKLAELLRAKKWKKAFKFWEGLDTYVREGVPTLHMEWVARKAIAEHNRGKRK